MSGMIWRVLIAVICVLFAFALIPPVLRVLELSVTADVMLIVKLCVAALAVLYIVRGKWPA